MTQQFFRFIITGSIATLINYAIFYVLFSYGAQYIIASASGFIIGVIVSFYINRSWTFNATEKKGRTFIKYVGVYTSSLVMCMLSLAFFVEVLAIGPIIANVLIIGIGTAINFLGTSRYVFNK